jgi:hypothetical protein
LAAAMSVRNVPLKFIEKILSMSSGVVSTAGFTMHIPAFATNTSSLPNFFTAFLNIR